MSEEEQSESGQTQYLTAEYKDGQLQIVEMNPYEPEDGQVVQEITGMEEEGGPKYIVDTKEGLMKLDFFNMTLVRCGDNESYELVSNVSEVASGDTSDGTITCVLQGEEVVEQDNQESIVMVQGDDGLVILNSLDQPADDKVIIQDVSFKTPAEVVAERKDKTKKSKNLSAQEMIEKAKELQKTKALLAKNRIEPKQVRGRKRKSDLPSPHELLASPSFKLFLYSCKQCPFKCNAIKEMTAHKQTEHASSGKSYKLSSGKPITSILQCARCPYKGNTYTQLMKHVQETHVEMYDVIELDTAEVEAADVLVCGACGFESRHKDEFRTHIEEQHGATTC